LTKTRKIVSFNKKDNYKINSNLILKVSIIGFTV